MAGRNLFELVALLLLAGVGVVVVARVTSRIAGRAAQLAGRLA